MQGLIKGLRDRRNQEWIKRKQGSEISRVTMKEEESCTETMRNEREEGNNTLTCKQKIMLDMDSWRGKIRIKNKKVRDVECA